MTIKNTLAFRYLLAIFAALSLFSCGKESKADSNNTMSAHSLAVTDPTAIAMVSAGLAKANEIRAENNLPELTLDTAITDAAQGHASDMLNRKYFEHETPEGLSPFDRMRNAGAQFNAAAENIAWGQRDAEQAFNSWLNSPGHRKNLLNPRYHRQGIGWANGYWVHDFAD